MRCMASLWDALCVLISTTSVPFPAKFTGASASSCLAGRAAAGRSREVLVACTFAGVLAAGTGVVQKGPSRATLSSLACATFLDARLVLGFAGGAVLMAPPRLSWRGAQSALPFTDCRIRSLNLGALPPPFSLSASRGEACFRVFDPGAEARGAAGLCWLTTFPFRRLSWFSAFRSLPR